MNEKMYKYVRHFQEVENPRSLELGDKGSSLIVLAKSGFKIPMGIIIVSETFLDFLRYNEIHQDIQELADNANENNYREISSEIKEIITKCELPKEIRKEIDDALKKLNKEYVSIRSSGTSEDSLKESFAGLHDSYLNIQKDSESILEYVKKCWASLFNERSMVYRIRRGISNLEGMAVIVQEMIDAEISGIAFTKHPIRESVMLIESTYGLCNLVVGGEVTPDSFLLSRSNLSILEVRINDKNKMSIRNEFEKIKIVDVDPPLRRKSSISSNRLKEIAGICLRIEKLFRVPQDIEWLISKNDIFILQSRAITVDLGDKTELTTVDTYREHEYVDAREVPALIGVPGSPGESKGPLKVITDLSDITAVKPGDILVVPKATPTIISAIDHISGIISEEGSIISHAAIIAREFMIPCVVGVKQATEILKNDVLVRMDGSTGKVYILDKNFIIEKKEIEIRTPLNLVISSHSENTNLPSLDEFEDINSLITANKLILTSTGKRVARIPNFSDRWSEFISSLTPEKIVDSWEEDLGNFLAFQEKLDIIKSTVAPSSILESLTALFTRMYMYNILADLYNPYPVIKKIIEKHVRTEFRSRVLELLVEYSNRYGIPYDDLKNKVFVPLSSRYIPLGMYRNDEISFKGILVTLGRLYAANRKRYYETLHKVENGKLEDLNVPIHRENVSKKDGEIISCTYKILSEVLPRDKMELLEKSAGLIDCLSMINDFNRLIGKEFAEEAKKVVELNVSQMRIEFGSDWPWDQILELYAAFREREE